MISKNTRYSIDNWTTQVRKGLLELCLFNLLADRELYAYDIVKRLAGVRGLVVTEGTMYPLLSRLRKTGLLSSHLKESPSGPARRYYRLTPEGHRMQADMNRYWDDLGQGIESTKEAKDINGDVEVDINL
jgi:PadR family transcriptional regulator PadR